MKKKLFVSLLMLCLMIGHLTIVTFAEEVMENNTSTIIYVSENGLDTNSGIESEPYKTIKKAYEVAKDGDTICLLSDISLEDTLILGENKKITIIGKVVDGTPKITYGYSGTETRLYMIEVGVENGVSIESFVTFENVIIDAEEKDIRCIRVCPKSQLTLNAGATVCNGRAIHQDETTGTNDWGGGIVIDGTAKLVMENGSLIKGCSAEWGGAIYLAGEMEMNGGVISDNTAVGDLYDFGGEMVTSNAHGGAILIRANRADYDESYDIPAKLTIHDGMIENNKATSSKSAFGGAIAILGTKEKNGTPITNELIIDGGTISNNEAGMGGAISAYCADFYYWNGNANIKIEGNVEITLNNARSYGGAIALFGSNTKKYKNILEMTGGMLSSNKAGNKGGAIFLQANGDEFYMLDGKICDNEAQEGGGVSINSAMSGEKIESSAYLLGGIIENNKATSGYPTNDNSSEKLYYGNAVSQNGNLYLDGRNAKITGDIRIGCIFDMNDNISTNRTVTLVGASDAMNDYELTSFESESLDGRAVVVPGNINYKGTPFTVSDAEPYLLHFKHNHKGVIANTDYVSLVPGSIPQNKSLVLYGDNKTYTVTYTDGVDDAVIFMNQITDGLRYGAITPAAPAVSTRPGYTFKGWLPEISPKVTEDTIYIAQWTKNPETENKQPTNTVKENIDETKMNITTKYQLVQTDTK